MELPGTFQWKRTLIFQFPLFKCCNKLQWYKSGVSCYWSWIYIQKYIVYNTKFECPRQIQSQDPAALHMLSLFMASAVQISTLGRPSVGQPQAQLMPSWRSEGQHEMILRSLTAGQVPKTIPRLLWETKLRNKVAQWNNPKNKIYTVIMSSSALYWSFLAMKDFRTLAHPASWKNVCCVTRSISFEPCSLYWLLITNPTKINRFVPGKFQKNLVFESSHVILQSSPLASNIFNKAFGSIPNGICSGDIKRRFLGELLGQGHTTRCPWNFPWKVSNLCGYPLRGEG